VTQSRYSRLCDEAARGAERASGCHAGGQEGEHHRVQMAEAQGPRPEARAWPSHKLGRKLWKRRLLCPFQSYDQNRMDKSKRAMWPNDVLELGSGLERKRLCETECC
jgi:hypothetical protein